jgi:hypothetical protein
MFRGLFDVWRIVRPRSLARMQKSLDDLAGSVGDLKRLVKQQAEQDKAIHLRVNQSAARFDEVTSQWQKLCERLDALTLRESQLRAVAAADARFDEALQGLPAVLDDRRIIAHVTDAVSRARLELEPLPHAVVTDLFPADFYEALVRGLPPYELFADKPPNRQQLKVPLAYGPVYNRRVWTYLLDVVLERGLQPALVDKFRKPLEEWIATQFPSVGRDPLGPLMELHSTDGRILLRGRGYRIPPHRDPKWGFLTVLLYLPRRGDSERWGTQLYAVDDDDPATSIAPHWIDPDRCRLVVDVPFRRNTALAFLNSHGAHGAFIPEDAEPPDLQRYIYQFRIGPTKDAITALVAMLPEDRRSSWEGKLVDYLA